MNKKFNFSSQATGGRLAQEKLGHRLLAGQGQLVQVPPLPLPFPAGVGSQPPLAQASGHCAPGRKGQLRPHTAPGPRGNQI